MPKKKITPPVAKKEKKQLKWSEMSPTELSRRIGEIREQIAALSVNMAVKRERNTRKRFNLRKDLARALTHLRAQAINVVK